MLLPSPLAHHSLLWKPLPEKIAANRTGGSDALFFPDSPPQTADDSSHGSAIETPTPRRNVRRECRRRSISGINEVPLLRELAILRFPASSEIVDFERW